MFKVPSWDDNPSPSDNLSVNKDLLEKNKKSKKVRLTEKSKNNVVTKPIFKTKSKVSPNLKKGKIALKNNNKKEIIITGKFKPKIDTINKQNLDKDVTLPNNNYRKSIVNKEIKNYDTDKLDEMILNEEKKKVEEYKSDDNEAILFQESPEKNNTIVKNTNRNDLNQKNKNNICKQEPEVPKNNGSKQILLKKDSKRNKKQKKNMVEIVLKKNNKTMKTHKKEAIKAILQNEKLRNPINVSSNSEKLRNRMMERLKAAKFRYLNEKLYTSRGSEAQKLFQDDPAAFQVYHEGYQQQVKKWPVKPLDVIIKRIQKMPKTFTIADMGCGEAELSRSVSHQVRSFDLVGGGVVEACDMAHTPLLAASTDVAVYCLALMGTDLTQYLVEANRILKVGGHLLIAEVESRFDNVEAFTKEVQKLGFSLKKLDKTHQVFFFMEFTKVREAPVKKSKLPTLSLKPCFYKKR